MTDFVVGFMREALSDRVLMVRKTKPAWQAGLLNGVGGKVDHYLDMPAEGPEELGYPQERTRLETPIEAMVREFKEETGIDTAPDEWRLIMYMKDPRDFYAENGGTVYWFAATRRFLPKLPPRVLDSGEELTTMRVCESTLRVDVLATVRWAIPMAFLDPTLNALGADDDVAGNVRAAIATPGGTPKVPKVPKKSRKDVVTLKIDAREAVESIRRTIRAVVADNVRLHRKHAINPDAHLIENPPCGCKLKFLHKDGTPLCECADVCMGYGMSPDNLERAQAALPVKGDHPPHVRAAMDESWKAGSAIQVSTNVNGVRKGDHVVNRARTEHGLILAIEGDKAWVQSKQHEAKRVTMFTADLEPFPGLSPRRFASGAPVMVNGATIVDVAPVKGVVHINGEDRQHNGRSLGDKITLAADGQTYTKPGDAQIYCAVTHDAIGIQGARGPGGNVGGKPIVHNSRSVGLDGHDRVVPGEALETPDADWHGGGQEHFGGPRGALPPMQQQAGR